MEVWDPKQIALDFCAGKFDEQLNEFLDQLSAEQLKDLIRELNRQKAKIADNGSAR